MDEPTDGPLRARNPHALLDAGWIERFVAAPPRLKEMVALYESLGYEVHLEPVVPDDLRDECQGCRLAVALFRVIYTRSKADKEVLYEGRALS